MRARVKRTLPVLLVLACLAPLAVAVPAEARTYFVSGQQVQISETVVVMRGDLIGTWTGTGGPFDTPLPLLHYAGTERFEGCLNRHHDPFCRHDPKGTLTFSFDAWIGASSTDPNTAMALWGACVHPITSGTGAFAGAQGVLTMIDTYTPDGRFTTRYDGNLILPDQPRSDVPSQAFSHPFAQTATAPAAAHATVAPRIGCGAS